MQSALLARPATPPAARPGVSPSAVRSRPIWLRDHGDGVVVRWLDRARYPSRVPVGHGRR
jgi:hypothetical protein